MTLGTVSGILLILGLLMAYVKLSSYLSAKTHAEIAAIHGVEPDQVTLEDIGYSIDGGASD